MYFGIKLIKRGGKSEGARKGKMSEEKKEMEKQLWDLYSLTDGELGEKPPEREMQKWR